MGAQPTAAKKPRAIFEQHYTPAQLAKRWGFSSDLVRRLFRHVEGVIVVDRPEEMHKRGYSTVRIPESVAEREYARLLTSTAAGQEKEPARRRA